MHVPLRLAEESSFTERMNRWVEQVLGPDYRRYCARRAWTPCVNLYEDVDSYYVVVELSGIEADKVELRVENNNLVLEGRRATPRPEACPGCDEIPLRKLRTHLMEIDHGQFSRTLQMPEAVDRDRTEASYRNGYLWITCPKVR